MPKNLQFDGYDWKKLRYLGRGTHGSVSLYINTTTGDRVAIKAVKRKDKRLDQHRQLLRPKAPSLEHTDLVQQEHIKMADKSPSEIKIRREIAIMRRLNHPHIVKLIDVLDDPLEKKIYIVLEYMAGGEIEWRTKASDPVQTVRQATRIIRDVMLGLMYLHRQGIVHRDIKPANLLWSDDRMTVKISDFGVSLYVFAAQTPRHRTDQDDDFEELMSDKFLNRLAGTPAFLAPELCSLSPPPTPTPGQSTSDAVFHPSVPSEELKYRTDIWALGVTYYCLLFGHPPWEEHNEFQLYKRISSDDFHVPNTMGSDRLATGGRHPTNVKACPDGVPVLAILDGLLQKDPTKRMSLHVLKSYPYLIQDISDLSLWQARTAQFVGEIEVTETDERAAVTRVHWRSRVAKGLHLIRNRISGHSLSEKPVMQAKAEATQGQLGNLSPSLVAAQGGPGAGPSHHVEHHRTQSLRKEGSSGLSQKVRGFLKASLGSRHEGSQHVGSRHSVGSPVGNRTVVSLGYPSPSDEAISGDIRRVMSDGDEEYFQAGEDSSSDEDYGETEGDRVQRELVGAGGLSRSQMSDEHSSGSSSSTAPGPRSPHITRRLGVTDPRIRAASPLSQRSCAEADVEDSIDEDEESISGPRRSVYSGSSSSNSDGGSDSEGSAPVEVRVKRPQQ